MYKNIERKKERFKIKLVRIYYMHMRLHYIYRIVLRTFFFSLFSNITFEKKKVRSHRPDGVFVFFVFQWRRQRLVEIRCVCFHFFSTSFRASVCLPLSLLFSFELNNSQFHVSRSLSPFPLLLLFFSSFFLFPQKKIFFCFQKRIISSFVFSIAKSVALLV